MSVLWLDFETRSLCDLPKEGAYNYALDISTEMICLCYAFDDGPVKTLLAGDPIPHAISDHRGQIRAHNASFDRLIMTHVLGVKTELEQWYCTATQARANCMPGGLGDLGRFAGLGMQKDYRGSQLISALSLPRPDGTFKEDPALLQEMVEYCAQDVRTMRAASQSMRELTEEELYDYHVNERVNDLGVLVDVELCEAAVKRVEEEAKEIEELVQELTEGEVSSVRSRRMCNWVYERISREAQELMELEDGKLTIGKTVRANLLQLAEENPDALPPEVADVVQCADDIWASSTAKFQRIAALADVEDRRVRGAFVFAGGSATGRASSYGIQVHNLPRKTATDPESVRAKIIKGEEISGVNRVLKSMLRPAFIAPKGYKLIVADWSAIEGRVNPWLSKTKSGEAKLQQYIDGLDPYKVNAATLYNVPYADVTKAQRQVGKIQELALGYMGGKGAFEVFSKGYGLDISQDEAAKAIRSWRRANPWASAHGDSLQEAYLRAMRNPHTACSAASTTYLFDGIHLWYSLPSGRVLCYPFARLEQGAFSYAKASFKPKADAKEWPRATIWPGLAMENVTQATANDLLRYALRELDDLYYRIILHVHDEIVLEVPDDQVEQACEDMVQIMSNPPEWAEGLPLEVPAPDVLTRYYKPE